MVPSFSNAKLFSTFVVHGFSKAISRRGYTAASQGVVSKGVQEARATARNAEALKKTGEDTAAATVTKEHVNWIPDPKTGIYRPEDSVTEICPAELRATLLRRN